MKRPFVSAVGFLLSVFLGTAVNASASDAIVIPMEEPSTQMVEPQVQKPEQPQVQESQPQVQEPEQTIRNDQSEPEPPAISKRNRARIDAIKMKENMRKELGEAAQ